MKYMSKFEKFLGGFALLTFIVDAVLSFMRHEIFGGCVSIALGISLVLNLIVIALSRHEQNKLKEMEQENEQHEKQ